MPAVIAAAAARPFGAPRAAPMLAPAANAGPPARLTVCPWKLVRSRRAEFGSRRIQVSTARATPAPAPNARNTPVAMAGKFRDRPLRYGLRHHGGGAGREPVLTDLVLHEPLDRGQPGGDLPVDRARVVYRGYFLGENRIAAHRGDEVAVADAV